MFRAFLAILEIGSFWHVFPIVVAILAGTFIIYFAKSKLNRKQQVNLLCVLTVSLSLFVLGIPIYKLITDEFDIKRDLPLYLNNFTALIFPIVLILKKPLLFRILFFWSMAWGVQGILTPDVTNNPQSLEYFRYWIANLMPMVIVFYVLFILKIFPDFNSVFLSIVSLQIYFIIVMIINEILHSNYMYLNAKPASITVLDYLGPWPYYLIVMQFMLIPYFLLFYFPFYLLKKQSSSNL